MPIYVYSNFHGLEFHEAGTLSFIFYMYKIVLHIKLGLK